MLIDDFNVIKHAYFHGELSYDQALKLAEPIMEKMNAKAIEIAKKRGVKPKKVTFAALMR